MKLMTSKQLETLHNTFQDQQDRITELESRIVELESLCDQWAVYASHLESKIRKYETVVIDHRIKSGNLVAHKVGTYQNGTKRDIYALSLPGMPDLPDNKVMSIDDNGHIVAIDKPIPSVTPIADTSKANKSNGNNGKSSKTENKNNNSGKSSSTVNSEKSTILENAAILTEVESKLGRKLDHLEHSKLQDKVKQWSTQESTMLQSDQWVNWLVRMFKAKK